MRRDGSFHRRRAPVPLSWRLSILSIGLLATLFWALIIATTRTSGMLTYEQGVAPFRNTDRLSDSDRSKLMGGTLEKVYGW